MHAEGFGGTLEVTAVCLFESTRHEHWLCKNVSLVRVCDLNLGL